MEKETEELQFLSAFGIVKEAFNILFRSSCTKLLGALTLGLLFPLSFATLAHTFISEPLLHKIVCNRVILYYQMQVGSPDRERTLWELNSESRELIVFVAAVLVFIYAFRILSTAAVAYTVASIYTADAKNLSFAGVMRIVPRVWHGLAITYIWDFMIFFAVYNAAGLALFLFTVFSVGMGYELNSYGFVFCTLLIILFFICLDVYMSTMWNLASVISVFEDKYYGLGAMRKSQDLIKGKRITALTLVMIYLIFSGGIGGFFSYAVLDMPGHGGGIAARAVYGAFLVGLLCLVDLMRLLTQSVFYFVCKSYYHESIDDKYCLESCNVGDNMNLNLYSSPSPAVFSWRIYMSMESISIDLSLS